MAAPNLSPRTTRLSIVNPATYRIWVQGNLDPQWSGRLGGLDITSAALEDGSPAVQLSGQVLDQAALHGVLNTLYDLRLPLLSIECFDDPHLAPA